MMSPLLGCASPRPRSEGPRVISSRETGQFSGSAALVRLHQLMEWPRDLRHPRRGASIEALAAMLREAGASVVERQPFGASDPATGQPYALTNLIAHWQPYAARRFVLATHFDTRPWADEEDDRSAHTVPVPGANDGTSGVAVVLELLATLTLVLPPTVGITVILFDGEELGHPGAGGYCMGSRHFAAHIPTPRPVWLERTRGGIVFDMVGDRDLHLLVEPGSAVQAPELTRRMWSVARRRGHRAFEDRLGPYQIVDDHVFLGAAGVPSVLLIDHDYDAWHTRDDTVDRVSAESLAAVGDTALHTLLELARSDHP